MRHTLNLVKKVISLKQSLFYREENHCCLCGSELNIEVQIVNNTAAVVEKVSCAKCVVNVRSKSHTLQ